MGDEFLEVRIGGEELFRIPITFELRERLLEEFRLKAKAGRTVYWMMLQWPMTTVPGQRTSIHYQCLR